MPSSAVALLRLTLLFCLLPLGCGPQGMHTGAHSERHTHEHCHAGECHTHRHGAGHH